MKKSRFVLMLLGIAAVLAVEMFGVSTPSSAYTYCQPPQAGICNNQPTNWVVCWNGLTSACFRNVCFAQCSGFFDCELTPSCP